MTKPVSPVPPVGPTAPFKIAPSTYFRCALLRSRTGLTAVLTTVAAVMLLLILAVVTADVRWSLVGMMVLFVAAPMVMGLVYFSIALSPEATASTLPHTIEILPRGSIHISYPGEEAEDAETLVPHSLRSSEEIAPELITSISASGTHTVITLHNHRLIIIPDKVISQTHFFPSVREI